MGSQRERSAVDSPRSGNDKAQSNEQQRQQRIERKSVFRTTSGLAIKRVYEASDAPRTDKQISDQLGQPGAYPYTRGVQPNLYRGRLWTMRQYAGYGSAEETNRRFHYLLSAGQTGLSTAFDLPTQIGYDADHPLSAGEVGRVGVSISSLKDMERLLANLPLGQVSTSMTINAPAAVLLAMYLVVAEQQGISWTQVSGTIQNDILKEYVARGTYIFPPGPSMRLITDVLSFCSEHVPQWNPISVSGYHLREAGATAVQELAFTLANGIAYVQAALDAGLELDSFAPRISFFFNAHNDFFEEIAKYRAARRMWAKVMKERFGATTQRSMQLRFHTQTAGSTLTAQQPENNVIRVTLQALAAVLGGTQSLHTNAQDEALALPTEATARVALRTQQIIAHETGVADTVDPLGGSYFVEALTDNLEQEAWRYIAQIDAMGGAVAAIEQGYVQREIHRAAYQTQRAIESSEQVVVGVNQFVTKDDPNPTLQRVDEQLGRNQAQRLKELRAERSPTTVQAALTAVERAAGNGQNLMPPILDAVRSYATTGEICDALRRVFGEYRPAVF